MSANRCMEPSCGSIDCARGFQALTGGLTPLHWQTRLFAELKSGRVPLACTLPTGLGKTSAIPIWLIALAGGAELPRRLVYIVNRRTVVDQATDVVAAMHARLLAPDDKRWEAHRQVLRDLADRLRRLGTHEVDRAPLAVSTLRGELADNGEWKVNPARAAIIIGTIDMIGSKLLFSGYGDARYGRAHHAGLIGQDALIVHDEAHLSPAFDALLDAVTREQVRTSEARPIRVLRLSATARGSGDGVTPGAAVFGIEDQDRNDSAVKERLSARKCLEIVEADKGKEADAIAEKALECGAGNARMLVYVRSPETAQRVRERLTKGLKQRAKDAGSAMTDEQAAERIGLLTGTIRGHERDQLTGSPLFRAFQSKADGAAPRKETLFLVSTSAGEVGADWDADHLVCDLTTLDSMIQRFGRVNRLGGEGRAAKIAVVTEKAAASRESAGDDNQPDGAERKPGNTKKKSADKYQAAVMKTDAILRRIAQGDGNVSPAALSRMIAGLSHQEREAAFSPQPTILPATDILFDHWSLTSIAGDMPGRPAVEDYLHGVAAWEPPETHVAWRMDIALLARAGGVDQDGEAMPCSGDDLEEVFDAFPLRSAETLRDRTERVQEQLRKIAEHLRRVAEHRTPSTPEDDADTEEPDSASDDSNDSGAAEKAASQLIGPNPWLVRMRGGSVEWVRLEDIAPTDREEAKQAQHRLAFATVVLDVKAGGLKRGILDGTEKAPANATTLDVAEVVHDGVPARQRVIAEGDRTRALLGGEVLVDVAHATIALAAKGDEDAEPSVLEYRVARGQDREPGERLTLSDHNAAVGAAAERIGKALGLDEPLVKGLRLAGQWHDAGKARAQWQRYASNWEEKENRLRDGHPIAKSERYGHPKMLGGYRHEFGSLIDAARASEVRSLDAETRDLVLHLIAAHHGWGRPHFEPKHFDMGDPGTPRPSAENEAAAAEAMQRFGRLQSRFGRWGLAWLEALLRCADAEAATKIGGRPSPEGGER